jgi:hypothetical protein
MESVIESPNSLTNPSLTIMVDSTQNGFDAEGVSLLTKVIKAVGR